MNYEPLFKRGEAVWAMKNNSVCSGVVHRWSIYIEETALGKNTSQKFGVSLSQNTGPDVFEWFDASQLFPTKEALIKTL